MNDADKIRIVEDILDGVIDQYIFHMKKYADDTAVMSMIQYNHTSYQFILHNLGKRAVPYLLRDVQRQRPNGSFSGGSFSFWGACSLLWGILGEDSAKISDKDRGKLAPIRKAWVNWGVEKGYLE